MRWKEGFLWLIFLILCFTAGYVKGILPEYRFNFFWSEEEKVKILAYSEKIFPPFFIAHLEKVTHTEIELDVTQTYSDFLARSVARSEYSLFILPRHWSELLSDQNLLLSLAGLKGFFQEKLHTDFPVLQNRIFPWVWVPTTFIATVSQKPSPKTTLQIIEDDDHIYQVLQSLQPPQKVQKISLFEEADEITNEQIKEINAFRIKDFGAVQKKEDWPQSLFLFDIVVPKNTPQRVTSIDLLKSIFENDSLQKEMSQQAFGITTQNFETTIYPAEKKASSIRNQSLQHLLRPVSVDQDLRNDLLRKYLN